MRRWEDWERSRLRKLKREEKRRRDFERSHPSGYNSGGERDYLVAPDTRSIYTRSQYDGSDTFSLNSSDDDHWGQQIGGYNEHNAQYPPPPVAFIHPQDVDKAQTVDGDELKAMLDMGFDDRPPLPNTTYAPRFQLTDGSTASLVHVAGNGYSPLSRSGSPGTTAIPHPHTALSPTTPTTPIPGDASRPPRSAGPGGTARYGPLGPLDPAAAF